MEEQLTLKIESINPKLKKDGSTISGNNKGRAWQIFQINDKYSFFQSGGGVPDLYIGETYDFILKTETTTKDDKQYINYTLSIDGGYEVKREGDKKYSVERPVPFEFEGDITIMKTDLERAHKRIDMMALETVKIWKAIRGEKVEEPKEETDE